MKNLTRLFVLSFFVGHWALGLAHAQPEFPDCYETIRDRFAYSLEQMSGSTKGVLRVYARSMREGLQTRCFFTYSTKKRDYAGWIVLERAEGEIVVSSYFRENESSSHLTPFLQVDELDEHSQYLSYAMLIAQNIEGESKLKLNCNQNATADNGAPVVECLFVHDVADSRRAVPQKKMGRLLFASEDNFSIVSFPVSQEVPRK